MDLLAKVTEAALAGIGASVEEALELACICSVGQLQEVADHVRSAYSGSRADTCSIVNARSGRCGEDCKWCAQSARHSTGITEYDIIERGSVMEAAAINAREGVGRFSLVTSGRRVSPRQLDRFCDYIAEIRRRHPALGLCASMGLLDRDAMRRLRQAGVTRYHCNLESSPGHFARLCTTHTYADKLATIRAALDEGLEVCSGGIIGMGETLRDRLELAAAARDAGAVSIPVNILNPIPGTPLEHTPLIDEEEIERSVALMRLVAPKCTIRFAGGRKRLSSESMRRMMRGGVNGAIVGDMLTSLGNTLAEDRQLFADTGFSHPQSEEVRDEAPAGHSLPVIS
ncbi:MAG: biotin synthase BioB [Candidatus Amulumruptor caecigallinarius]|nr:biotin synthase BioB [Candidatus Amulumruptor caecigallinarius]MCM1396579.1 biotin synthase BioB [Candidatus Amulumruptor caecigallinarius]MCM1453363.1 biotin synthase BioB [bacterium]